MKSPPQRVTALLHREEICVDVADCAEEGLDLARRFDYDIIITELQLRVSRAWI